MCYDHSEKEDFLKCRHHVKLEKLLGQLKSRINAMEFR